MSRAVVTWITSLVIVVAVTLFALMPPSDSSPKADRPRDPPPAEIRELTCSSCHGV